MLVPRGRLVAAAAALACAAVSPAAHAAPPSVQPGNPPEPCDTDLFADQIGTAEADVLEAPARPQRLWGLAGPDILTGSPSRATCLFGGRDGDVLDLAAGGGVAWGEAGADTITGSGLADRIDGGDGVDGLVAGGGDDKVDARDGNAEVVDCGAGNDLVDADRADVLIGCDVALRSGRPTPMLATPPRAATASAVVRTRFRAPEAAGPGAYRVLLVTGSRGEDCAEGPLELARLPEPGRRVAAGQVVRLALRPPEAGWCQGVAKAALVLHRRCRRDRCAAPSPGEPIARLRFSAER